MNIALLNPGAMGATIGAALVRSGHQVSWLSPGRSEATAARAAEAGLTAAESLAEIAATAEGLISVCPPDAAREVAEAVMAAGYAGIYLDANAVAPATARDLAALIGGQFVDGGIVGPPALQPGSTRLYLSGDLAARVKSWFIDPALEVSVVDDRAGSASALKMCYAAYTKGSSALLLAVRALAEAEGVTETLLREWDLSQPDLGKRSEGTARGTAPKAWRFVGEMEEIAATFEARNLPGGFHQAAADVYRRMRALKEVPDADLVRVLSALLENPDQGPGSA